MNSQVREIRGVSLFYKAALNPRCREAEGRVLWQFKDDWIEDGFLSGQFEVSAEFL